LDMNQHSHLCVQCVVIYGCGMDHHAASGTMREGGRCCPACRAANIAALDRLEKARRATLYV